MIIKISIVVAARWKDPLIIRLMSNAKDCATPVNSDNYAVLKITALATANHILWFEISSSFAVSWQKSRSVCFNPTSQMTLVSLPRATDIEGALVCGDVLLDLTIFYKLRTELRESLTLAEPGQEWLILPAQHHAAVQSW